MQGLIAALWVVSALALARGTEWFLLSRHGECASLSSLNRRNPAWGQVQDPYEFIEHMRTAGHVTEVQEHDTGKGMAVQVEVPAVELSLMFVERGLCREFIDHGR